MFRQAMETFRDALKQKYGTLYLIGTVVGIAVAFIGASVLPKGQTGTLVCLGGAVVSIFCGNAFSQLIAIIQYNKTNSKK